MERRAADECWPWTASVVPNGYGQFGVTMPPTAPTRQVHLSAHRLAWALSHGPIPAGIHVLHRCDNRRCCNPAHLFLGTHLDNMRDAAEKGRLRVARKRTRQIKALVIARWLAGGVSQKALAAEYGVGHITVGRWLKPYKAKPYERRTA